MFKISPCKDSLNYTKSHEIQNHQRCTHDRGIQKHQASTHVVIMSQCVFVCLMVFNATFNNISVISWRSVLSVEETGRPGKKHRYCKSLTNFIT